ncbi:unnamed protein product [Camellia sinensis]
MNKIMSLYTHPMKLVHQRIKFMFNLKYGFHKLITPMIHCHFRMFVKHSMTSFTSTATSSIWPRRMCACGHGPCIVKISRSTKNLGRPYFAYLRPVVSAQFITGHNCINITNPLTNSFIICTHQPCVSWIGWCEEPRRQSMDYVSSRNDIVMQLQDDVIHIQQSLRLLKTIVYVLCIVVVILLLRM